MIMVRGFVDEVVICNGLDEIARHQRSYQQEDAVFDPTPLGSAQGKTRCIIRHCLKRKLVHPHATGVQNI